MSTTAFRTFSKQALQTNDAASLRKVRIDKSWLASCLFVLEMFCKITRRSSEKSSHTGVKLHCSSCALVRFMGHFPSDVQACSQTFLLRGGWGTEFSLSKTASSKLTLPVRVPFMLDPLSLVRGNFLGAFYAFQTFNCTSK